MYRNIFRGIAMNDYEIRLKKIGLNIAYYRKLKSLTQEQLAEKIGIERAYLGKIEAPNMVSSFSLEILFRLADALEVSESDLLNYK